MAFAPPNFLSDQFDSHKNLFLEKKKSNRTRATLDLARVEKREVIPDSAVPKGDFLFLSRTTICRLLRIRGPNCEGTKNLSL